MADLQVRARNPVRVSPTALFTRSLNNAMPLARWLLGVTQSVLLWRLELATLFQAGLLLLLLCAAPKKIANFQVGL